MPDSTPDAHAVARARFKADLAAIFVRILGVQRTEAAERLAESIARHRDNLLEAGGGVLEIDPSQDSQRLAQAMREHSEQLVEAAIYAVQAVAGEALAIGLNRHG